MWPRSSQPPSVTSCPSPTHTQSTRTPQSIIITALGVGTRSRALALQARLQGTAGHSWIQPGPSSPRAPSTPGTQRGGLQAG